MVVSTILSGCNQEVVSVERREFSILKSAGIQPENVVRDNGRKKFVGEAIMEDKHHLERFQLSQLTYKTVGGFVGVG